MITRGYAETANKGEDREEYDCGGTDTDPKNEQTGQMEEQQWHKEGQVSPR